MQAELQKCSVYCQPIKGTILYCKEEKKYQGLRKTTYITYSLKFDIEIR